MPQDLHAGPAAVPTPGDVRARAALGEDSCHRFLPGGEDVSALAAELAALANSAGGFLYLGVDADGSVRGLDRSARERLTRLVQAAASSLTPPLRILVHIVATSESIGDPAGARAVIVVAVPLVNVPCLDSAGLCWAKSGAGRVIVSPDSLAAHPLAGGRAASRTGAGDGGRPGERPGGCQDERPGGHGMVRAGEDERAARTEAPGVLVDGQRLRPSVSFGASREQAAPADGNTGAGFGVTRRGPGPLTRPMAAEATAAGMEAVDALEDAGEEAAARTAFDPTSPEAEEARRVYGILERDPRATALELAAGVGVCKRTVLKRLALLKELGVLRRHGSSRSGFWELVPERARDILGAGPDVRAG